MLRIQLSIPSFHQVPLSLATLMCFDAEMSLQNWWWLEALNCCSLWSEQVIRWILYLLLFGDKFLTLSIYFSLVNQWGWVLISKTNKLVSFVTHFFWNNVILNWEKRRKLSQIFTHLFVVISKRKRMAALSPLRKTYTVETKSVCSSSSASTVMAIFPRQNPATEEAMFLGTFDRTKISSIFPSNLIEREN